jgi:hypothetical protein
MFWNDYTGIKTESAWRLQCVDMWVGMMLDAFYETQVAHPMMAATRHVQEDGAVVFSKIVVNQNSCQDLSEKMKITVPEQYKLMSEVRQMMNPTLQAVLEQLNDGPIRCTQMTTVMQYTRTGHFILRYGFREFTDNTDELQLHHPKTSSYVI